MRAISIHQPFASAIAYGIKTIETRTWPAPKTILGQHIAIHASKAWDELALRWIESCYAALPLEELAETNLRVLPRGVVVATAVVRASQVIDAKLREHIYIDNPDDLIWGNFKDGNFAWHLDQVELLVPAIPTQGRQGIFNVNLD